MLHNLLRPESSLDITIEITVNSIENVIRKDDIQVFFVAVHNGVFLGECIPITIKSACEDDSLLYKVGFTFRLLLNSEDKKNIDLIVSTPIIIKALYTSKNEQAQHSSVSGSAPKEKSIFSARSSILPEDKVLGICNIDLISVILGEQKVTEKIILETPTFSFDNTLVSWKNLPRIMVTISRERPLPFSAKEHVNFLYVTVESIYNLPESFSEDLQYKAGTILYSDSEVPQNLIFENGTYTKYRDVERTKRWKTLQNLENRARLSKYKLDCDFMGIKNEFRNEIDLATKVCEDTPRIEWNTMHRCVLWQDGIQAMQNHISRFKYWPFQFMVKENIAETNSKKGQSPKTQLYQCYVDLSELLFPGKTSCRVVAQLYTYNSTDITDKVGVEENIFVPETPVKELKEKERKHKTSKHTLSVSSETEIFSSLALVSENGEPTVVVVEIELYEPIIPCRIIEDFTHLIEDMIPKTSKKPLYVYSNDIAEEQYENCIQKLAEVITECYRDFREEEKNNSDKDSKIADNDSEEEGPKEYCFDPESKEITCFTQYLYRTGVYLSLRSTLRTKVTMLLDQKFKTPPNFVDSEKSQNFIASVYTYLVEQMHIAVNKIVEGKYVKDLPNTVDAKTMYFYAEEAYELGDLEVAQRLYTTAISSSKQEPEPWTRYAIFLNKIGNVERAKECCLEAITLDRKYTIALILYSAMLFECREYRQAECFLRALVNFYPRFVEGWTILHLFYIRTEYYPGVDLSLRIAEICMKDKNREITFDEKPLVWSTKHCPENNVYMATAVLLLKLHLREFAEIAIAQEKSISNGSTHFLYYIAVEHYLSGRYEDTLSYLEEIKCKDGMDYSISSLMGHCYFKLGDIKNAMNLYEFAYMLFDRPDDLHLIEIRLGYYYYDTGDFERAKRVFLNACRISPSSQTWLGAGISLYELSAFEEAEMALSEANRIDSCNPDTWGYLCLLNMTLMRYDEFSQCYTEMTKNNLKNRKLWLRITNMMEALNYAPPTGVTETDDLIEDYSKESFEEQFEIW